MPTFEQARSILVAAPPAKLQGLITDFHEWTKWSPWEELDPNMARTYRGAASGVGAGYAWVGKKAGQGSMEITGVAPERIDVDLDFLKPIKIKNKVTFRFEPEGAGTRVTWTMFGTRGVLLAMMGKLFSDAMVGKDFEKGLAKLKAAAEG